MNATFKVDTIAKHHNGDVEVTLAQVYDHTTRQLNDSTNPEGEITLHITDKTGFFQSGQKYLVNFRSMTPTGPATVTLANGQNVDPADQAKWLKENPDSTQADFVAYKNGQYANGRSFAAADGTHDNDPHRFDKSEQYQPIAGTDAQGRYAGQDYPEPKPKERGDGPAPFGA